MDKEICIPLLTKEEIKFLKNIKIENVNLNASKFPEALGLDEETFKKLLKIATKLSERALTTKEFFYFLHLLTKKFPDIPLLVWILIAFHAGVLKGKEIKELEFIKETLNSLSK